MEETENGGDGEWRRWTIEEMENGGEGGVVKDGSRIIEESRNRGIGVWLKGLLEKETYYL